MLEAVNQQDDQKMIHFEVYPGQIPLSRQRRHADTGAWANVRMAGSQMWALPWAALVQLKGLWGNVHRLALQ